MCAGGWLIEYFYLFSDTAELFRCVLCIYKVIVKLNGIAVVSALQQLVECVVLNAVKNALILGLKPCLHCSHIIADNYVNTVLLFVLEKGRLSISGSVPDVLRQLLVERGRILSDVLLAVLGRFLLFSGRCVYLVLNVLIVVSVTGADDRLGVNFLCRNFSFCGFGRGGLSRF